MHVIQIPSTSAQSKTPLVVRASLPRTFWSLGAFVEIGLIFCGIYLLAEAILKPLEADQASIIGAGVMLSLASVLLFFLIRPHRKEVLARPDAPRGARDWQEPPSLAAYRTAVQARREASTNSR